MDEVRVGKTHMPSLSTNFGKLNTASSSRLLSLPFLALSIGAFGVAMPSVVFAQASPVMTQSSFGAPPSGEIPLLYNDHTVYAKPDVLRKNRVLAAYAKNGHIYLPLRSMFEQMGGKVSVSSSGQTITAIKGTTSVSVTVGKNIVVLNGEKRPLDVPPFVHKGVVFVPVRVLSEALGAYVQWVPERRIAVVRYISVMPPVVDVPVATPPLAMVIPPAPPAPTASPVPLEPVPNYGFVQAAYFAPKNYDEFSAGQDCPEYILSAAYVFKGTKFALKGEYQRESYVTSDNLVTKNGNHYTQFATIDGGVAFTPVFKARRSILDARLEYQIASPNIYVGASYLDASNNFGYPHLRGVGVGLEKLPNLNSGIHVYGSGFYYPTVSGNYTVSDFSSPNNSNSYHQQYQVIKYDGGLALVPTHSPVYIFGGFAGNRYIAKQNAPISQTHNGPYVGLGAKL